VRQFLFTRTVYLTRAGKKVNHSEQSNNLNYRNFFTIFYGFLRDDYGLDLKSAHGNGDGLDECNLPHGY
jgi:hypothetical protein